MPKAKHAITKTKPATVKTSPWLELLEELRTCDEADAERLLKLELARKPYARTSFLLRIHSRLNNLRYLREVNELRFGFPRRGQ